jgi:hypothetical protein
MRACDSSIARTILHRTKAILDSCAWTGGVAARSSKHREASLSRADGVVDQKRIVDPPPRRFATPLLSRRGITLPDAPSFLNAFKK